MDGGPKTSARGASLKGEPPITQHGGEHHTLHDTGANACACVG
jgi:hypothetical protein